MFIALFRFALIHLKKCNAACGVAANSEWHNLMASKCVGSELYTCRERFIWSHRMRLVLRFQLTLLYFSKSAIQEMAGSDLIFECYADFTVPQHRKEKTHFVISCIVGRTDVLAKLRQAAVGYGKHR